MSGVYVLWACSKTAEVWVRATVMLLYPVFNRSAKLQNARSLLCVLKCCYRSPEVAIIAVYKNHEIYLVLKSSTGLR